MSKKKAKFKILLFYFYTDISHPHGLRDQMELVCSGLGLTGRFIISKEGINATLEGLNKRVEKFVKILKSDPRFAQTHFKISDGDGKAFPKLNVKLRDEIVSGHLADEDVDPNQITGKYIYADQLHQWYEEGKEFYVVDMRNDYEQKSGYFKDSILSNFANFRDLPEILEELKDLKDKTIVTVCTGGVRCEKASGFLVDNGFNDVYQLYGGIVTYMEAYPNQNFLGKLYVFDGRITMGFNTEDEDHVIVGKCEVCDKECDDYVNCDNLSCNRHFIACEECCVDGIKCPKSFGGCKVKNA